MTAQCNAYSCMFNAFLYIDAQPNTRMCACIQTYTQTSCTQQTQHLSIHLITNKVNPSHNLRPTSTNTAAFLPILPYINSTKYCTLQFSRPTFTARPVSNRRGKRMICFQNLLSSVRFAPIGFTVRVQDPVVVVYEKRVPPQPACPMSHRWNKR